MAHEIPVAVAKCCDGVLQRNLPDQAAASARFVRLHAGEPFAKELRRVPIFWAKLEGGSGVAQHLGVPCNGGRLVGGEVMRCDGRLDTVMGEVGGEVAPCEGVRRLFAAAGASHIILQGHG